MRGGEAEAVRVTVEGVRGVAQARRGTAEAEKGKVKYFNVCKVNLSLSSEALQKDLFKPKFDLKNE